MYGRAHRDPSPLDTPLARVENHVAGHERPIQLFAISSSQHPPQHQAASVPACRIKMPQLHGLAGGQPVRPSIRTHIPTNSLPFPCRQGSLRGVTPPLLPGRPPPTAWGETSGRTLTTRAGACVWGMSGTDVWVGSCGRRVGGGCVVADGRTWTTRADMEEKRDGRGVEMAQTCGGYTWRASHGTSGRT